MKRKDKEQVLSIIYDCIVKPEIDEGDRALVDYRRAKMMIAAARSELLMNAVNCDVPHRYIREMATGNSEEPEPMDEEEERDGE